MDDLLVKGCGPVCSATFCHTSMECQGMLSCAYVRAQAYKPSTDPPLSVEPH